MDDRSRLEHVAAAIVDGAAVDWRALESSDDRDERALAGELKVLAAIASLHRSTPPGDTAGGVAASDDAWGHLRLVEVIGHGTYGDVYRAWDPHLERDVALKLLQSAPRPGDSGATVSDPQRVVHEGRLLARVRHPHVVTVYGAETRAGTVGIWMELIRGRTLDRIVREQGPLGAREAAALGLDLASALAAVHRAGLLHRDVTARNVMREEGGRLVLMDFGAGDIQAARTIDAGSARGTPLYMAPELLAGRPADERADLYALGVLLYFAVSGGFPVTGRTLQELRRAHADGARARLRDVRPDLPAAFIHSVESMLAPDPAARPQTAGDAESLLQHVLVERKPAGYSRLTLPPRALAWTAATAATVALAVYSVSPWIPVGASRARSEGTVAATLATRLIHVPEGVWLFSNPSDDGRYAAGMITETGDGAVVDLSTGETHPLGIGTYDEGYASLGTLSPDGQWVAIDWHQGLAGTLVLARADGHERRVLVDSVEDVYPYQWSRDGAYVLTLLTEHDGTSTIALVAAADGALRRLRSLGPGATPDRMSLSPDGRYIVYDIPEPASPRNRDIVILDAHTGMERPLVSAPGEDGSPLWTPDGSAVLFLSDRNRTTSAWLLDVKQGRAVGEPRLVRDDIGRVWLQGFTADGTLQYFLSTGFAEAWIGSIDGSAPPRAIAPREPVSNFFPVWSSDGRQVAYSSERAASPTRRELWVFDVDSGRERPVGEDTILGRPLAWSPDARRILAAGPNTNELFLVDVETGKTRLLADGVLMSRWTAAGVAARTEQDVRLIDPDTGEVRRVLPAQAPASPLTLGLDGRTVMERSPRGDLWLRHVAPGGEQRWHDPSITRLTVHALSPHADDVAYTGTALSTPDAMVLNVWQRGQVRELLRVRAPERLILAGWTSDGGELLVLRRPAAADEPTRLWRVPVDGSAPLPTTLAMDALRDISLHPDGRQVAFNAYFKSGEHWRLEQLAPPQ